MEFNKLILEKIFFDYIIKNTQNGSIEIPVYSENDNIVEMRTFNITLVVDNPENEFNLNITNKDKFIDLLFEYISVLYTKKKIKNTDTIIYYLTLIWCNCTYEDLQNPEKFLQKYIEFENNQLFEECLFASNISELLNSDIYVTISAQMPNFETPYLYNVTIKNGNKEYYLPSISYGIYDNCCYIYATKNKKSFSNDPSYEKKIKRALYKINAGIYETDEYISYKNGDSYYPENISDVSPSTILSLTCFLIALYEKNITKVKVVPYLPLRYKNKEKYYQKLYAYKSKTSDNKDELLSMLEKEHLRIQQNLTEKLIRSFRRINFHFPSVKILSFPMELDECMCLNISKFTEANNELLNECLNSHESSNSLKNINRR